MINRSKRYREAFNLEKDEFHDFLRDVQDAYLKCGNRETMLDNLYEVIFSHMAIKE